MSIGFLYPNYLWLLALVPLVVFPAIIHRLPRMRSRFGLSLLVRCLLLILIILALAGIQLRLPESKLTTVFILDVSDSIPPAEQERGENFIRKEIRDHKPPGDEAAIILFGEDALVERLAAIDPTLPEFASIPISSRTDIAGALQLAQAIMPAEGFRRIVLLSDGRENLRSALEQAEFAAANAIEMRYVPLGGVPGEVEVWIEDLAAPSEVRLGESFDLITNIQSTANQTATLRLFRDGNLVESREVRLLPGENRFSLPVNTDPQETYGGGFERYRLQVIPEVDTRLQNNEASAFTVVHGPPRILIIANQAEEAQNLSTALQVAEMRVVVLPPGQMPAGASDLAAFDTIVLVNTPADSIPDGAMQALPVLVRDLGKGLVMIGGESSLGAGGYLRTPLEAALPVDMDVRDRELQANLALVLAVDKSGSMGRCHCDNPDLNQTYTRAEIGLPKVDIAKEAIMRAAAALGNQDFLGVVAFDDKAHWSLQLAPLTDRSEIERAIGAFGAAGSTNLVSGVEAAYQALQGVEARRKHVILLTDGWVRTGDLTTLAAKMKEQGITLSIVAAGQGSAEYLAGLATIGGGTYYPATDMLSVPDIFLKETIQSVGDYLIEEPFYPLPAVPSPVLRGLDAANLPILYGYNGSTPKSTARLDLLTARGDPLLATWQYGLGRSAVWASDFKGKWAANWVQWSGFPRFAAQLVSWTLPAPKTEGLEATLAQKDNQAIITLSAFGKDGQPLNFLDVKAMLVTPDLKSRDVVLKQVSAGLYQAVTDARQPGIYLVRIGANQDDQSLGQVTLGLVIPYSPEYKTSGIARGFLEQLAQLTGGGELPVGSAFERTPDLRSVASARQVGLALLLIAALLFPLDVGLRRLTLQASDFQRLRSWIKVRFFPSSRQALPEPRIMSNLFRARERARQRLSTRNKAAEEAHIIPATNARTSDPAGVTGPEPEADETKPPASSQAASLPRQASPEEALQRLHEAKKRARKG